MFNVLHFSAHPLYGLTSNVAPPPLSALLSVCLILGIDWVGLFIIRSLSLSNVSDSRWIRFQATIIGAAAVSIFIYPLALAGYFTRINGQILAMSLAIIGTLRFGRYILKFIISCPIKIHVTSHWKFPSLMTFAYYIVFLGMGLLALGPITDADSLDYHVGVALHILNTGAFPFSPEWFHSRLAGSGEVLIALGLAIGAEQFGSLLQFAGLVGVTSVFKHGFNTQTKWREICSLSVITVPLFAALCSSSKPQLLPVGMTTCALMLAVSIYRGSLSANDVDGDRNRFVLICLLVMTAAVSKFNFLLSGAIVGLFAFFSMISRRKLLISLGIGGILFLTIMLPPLIWKSFYYGGNLFSALVTPFPGSWPGTDFFEQALRDHKESNVFFPLSLLIPETIGKYTTTLGVGLFIALSTFVRRRDKCGNILIIMTVLFFIGSTLGQNSSRFFIEPYLWLIMIAMLQMQPRCSVPVSIMSVLLLAQSILVSVAISIGIISLSTGSLTSTLRERTMLNHAMSYSEMQWADTVLPKDAHLLIRHRFVALSPRFSISSDWRSYNQVNESEESVYEKITREKIPTFILITLPPGKEPELNHCDGVIYAGPYRTRWATRNTFNKGPEYDVWIVQLKEPGARCEI